MRVIMKKMNNTSASYWLGPAVLLSLFILSGCAGSSMETRYDDTTRVYSSPPSGVKSTAGKHGSATSQYTIARNEGSNTYSSPQSGVKSTTGQYDNATARYTLRQGGTSAPESDTIKTISKSPEIVITGSPMVIAAADVLFEFDKSALKESCFGELDRWVDYFQNNPVVTAEIYGHTDSTGTVPYNQKLSEKRAQAVVDYLVGKGVGTDRLTARGFGESQPIAPNTTEVGRQENRRVEVNF